jgi:hypothetical protein
MSDDLNIVDLQRRLLPEARIPRTPEQWAALVATARQLVDEYGEERIGPMISELESPNWASIATIADLILHALENGPDGHS